MRDFIIALLVGFVLLRLFRAFYNSGRNSVNNNHTHRGNRNNRNTADGEVRIENLRDKKKSHDDDKGEYVEYEEIK